MKKFSTSNTYSTSEGQRLNRSQIEDKIRDAKQELITNHLIEFGYAFCVECMRNGSGTRLDCSHVVSVKECLESGRAELAHDVDNLRLLCRECHKKHDGL